MWEGWWVPSPGVSTLSYTLYAVIQPLPHVRLSADEATEPAIKSFLNSETTEHSSAITHLCLAF